MSRQPCSRAYAAGLRVLATARRTQVRLRVAVLHNPPRLSIGLLSYVGLLSRAGKISRFGRQARLGERGDSGLTAYRLSEFATLDKMRLRYKTRLGRFITSP